MTREIVLDTETTGLSPRDGHRIVEIGAIELVNHMPTGESFHVYLDPQRDMPKEAEAVHGLSSAFLKGKPLFGDKAQEFLTFVADSTLVIHNASFDMTFINWELKACGQEAIAMSQVVDTLAIARQKFPMASNSLDALCKRFGVDLSRRTKHGALLDSELLADVYLELIGGRQTALGLAATGQTKRPVFAATSHTSRSRPAPLPSRLSENERAAHAALVKILGDKTLWQKPADGG
jgi:DNA polymerase III subunit epsilon